MILLILYLFLALFVSSLCSIMEAVLLSTPHSYIRAKKEKRKRWAILFDHLKKNIGKPLSAILSLNTIAHTVGAAGVGAQAVKVFGEAYFGLISGVLTLLILVFTEIIPKTIGARYWKGLASVSAHIIRAMIIITYPLVIMSTYITRLISKGGKENIASREEISAMARIGAEEGIFNEKEYKILQNLLRLKDIRVSEIITPRVVVTSADEEMTLNNFLQKKDYLYHSRIPVYSGNKENITGYVLRQFVLESLAEDKLESQLKDIKRDIETIPATNPLFDVWERLLERREHIALVINEYGGMEGIVTMEDIFETLLGLEIVDETDHITDMQHYAKKRWEMRKAKYNLVERKEKASE